MPNQMDEYLTTEQVAKMLQISVDKLKKDRVRKGGLPYVKVGAAVRYPRSDVQRYLELATVHPRQP